MNFLEKSKQLADGAATITDWLGSGALVVPQQQAQNRANVCLKCAMNTPGGVLVETVAKAIKEQLRLKKHLELRVDGEKKLLSCSGCSCYLRLKIWLPIDRLGLDAESLEKFDQSCWQRTEFKL